MKKNFLKNYAVFGWLSSSISRLCIAGSLEENIKNIGIYKVNETLA